MQVEPIDRAPEQEASMIRGLTSTALPADDVPRARRFFAEKLGLGTEDDMGDEFSQFTTRDGSLWAVMQAPEGASTPGVELYLRIEDVDLAYSTWKARGVEMVTEPWDA